MNLMPVYLVMAFGGIGSLLALTFLDEIADVVDDAFDALFDIGGEDIGTRWISSYSLIAFVGFAGVGGALGKYLGVSDEVSVFFAFFSGLCGGGMSALFMRWMKSQERSTHIASGALVGKLAEVTIAIPENGTGEVRVMLDEAHRFAAQSANGGAIPRGTEVVIDKEGSTLTVRQKR